MPAPDCTTTSAPSAFIFFTVSGVAPTRGSKSDSAGIAIFMMPPSGDRRSDEEISHRDQQDDNEPDNPLGQRQKQVVGALVLGVVVAVRRCVFDLAVVGHFVLRNKSLSRAGLA